MNDLLDGIPIDNCKHSQGMRQDKISWACANCGKPMTLDEGLKFQRAYIEERLEETSPPF